MGIRGRDIPETFMLPSPRLTQSSAEPSLSVTLRSTAFPSVGAQLPLDTTTLLGATSPWTTGSG
ncbi:hypothetical protein C5O80_31935 [Burkholderia sp. SRS-46]|nr:hypothetical protein C5O80_31935 [Burkholderia sp. SRS-46]